MVEFLKYGLYDSIQDIGRFGYQSLGVPLSGAMDQYASALANSVLDNWAHAAVLEFTLVGPKLKFHTDTAICITGMESQPHLNGQSIDNNCYIKVAKSDVLSFGQRRRGSRGYLAVLGGFQSEKILNSRSFYKDITGKERFGTGDRIEILELHPKTNLPNALVKTPTLHFENTQLKVFRGMEYELLSSEQKQLLCAAEFTISKDSNRMAYQVEETVSNTMPPIITSPVLPGTVQLTPSGQLMLLMRDCQTTGGYPRIFQLSEMAINQLSQKMTGEKVSFELSEI